MNFEKRSLDDDTFVPDILNLENRSLDDDTFVPDILNLKNEVWMMIPLCLIY